MSEGEEVGSWLRGLGLAQYAPAFEENGLTLDILPTLTDADLQQCGVAVFGHRKKLLLAAEKLRPRRATAAASAAIPAFAACSSPRFSAATPIGIADQAVSSPPDLVIAGAPPPSSRLPEAAPADGRKKRLSWKSFGGRFLMVSVVAHVLFGLGATYYVVQTIQAKRKLTFQGGPKSPNPSTRSVEHKVQMAKKQNTMSAPAQPKRITTTGAAKVSLPDMPALPKSDDMVAGKMPGMGGAGAGLSMAGGAGVGGGSGGGAMTLFGFRDAKGGGLAGSFYDLKQTRSRRPTGMTPEKFSEEVFKFTEGGWNESAFSQFFKSPKQLYAQQILIPNMSASEGPKAFDLADKVQPKMWLVLYKATLIPPEDGRFRFVGKGDDLMIVRFDGKEVLDYGQPDAGKVSSWKSSSKPIMYPNVGKIGMMPGTWFEVSVARKYPIEILIGERPGGGFFAGLLIEQQGVSYKKVSGNPILPLFRTSDANALKNEPQTMPPFDPSGPVWRAVR